MDTPVYMGKSQGVIDTGEEKRHIEEFSSLIDRVREQGEKEVLHLTFTSLERSRGR